MEELEEVRGKVINVSTLPTWVMSQIKKEIGFEYNDFIGVHIDDEDLTESDKWLMENFKGIENESMFFLNVDVELN